MRRFATVVGVLLLTGMLGVFVWWQVNRPLSRAGADELLRRAMADADNGRLDTSYAHLQRILAVYPDHHAARELLATVCVSRRLPQEAAEAIAKLPDEFLAEQFEKSVRLAKFLTSFGYLFEAEPLLRRLLAIRPQHVEARKEMLHCLRIAGENVAAAPLLKLALRDQRFELSDLLMATAPRLFWATSDDVKFMQNVGQRNNDPLTLLGYARKQIVDGNFAHANAILQSVLQERPAWQPARVRWAYASWLSGDDESWQKSMRGWDPDQLRDADAWFVWGVWHQHLRHPNVAARCFSEALVLEPKHVGAWSQLVKVLRELGFDAEAQRLKTYSERLALIDQYCQDVSHQPSAETVGLIAKECAAVGWHEETRAWLAYGKRYWSDYAWPEIALADSHESPDDDRANHPLARLVPMFDFHLFPLPKRTTVVPTPPAEPVAVPAGASTWRLDDEAPLLGISFRFQNGLDPKRTRAYMFEFAGPGVGVFDYDRDGWPDLHLTQGAPWPLNSTDTTLRDELFRNRGEGAFLPVADAARIGEPGYSQGPAVGDFDSDGFPDLYVCNIGPNRAYRNNGDGTFTEVTAEAGFAGDDWSISAAWADFNDDGWQDLYVVNYLTGDVFDRACQAADGRPVQCPPMQFPAASDRFYLSRGDGTFEDATSTAGIQIPDGKGMGVVVGRLSDAGSLGIFVANDTTANALFTRQNEPAAIPQFQEIGAMAGVAFGPLGNSQSSMGVAAGDANGDGRLDLFVTNWMAETSNLFLQGSGGVYEDQAIRFGIIAEGLLMEGWGAQFFDVDADGFVDLFVANGHLEEYDSKGGRMPPHLFHNRDGRKFAFVARPEIGGYFANKYLGRSVAVWDWNRDGRQDLVVSHVTDPVAVLTNRTPDAGHSISLQLIGVQSARDPIGTLVTLSAADRKLVRELVSGDGYAATNERKLHFGLGSFDGHVELDVSWPDGSSQHFADLARDAEYVLIQGRAAAIPGRRFDAVAVKAAQ